MSNIAASIIVSVLGLAVIAPVAADKFNRTSKGDTALKMPDNDDFTSPPMFAAGGGSSPTPCPADVNHDGFVDGADMATLLGAWGPCISSNQGGSDPELTSSIVLEGVALEDQDFG